MTPNLEDIRKIFHQAPFIADVGLELVSIGSGECITRLVLLPKHLQQHGLVHAGVQITAADHTAGAAASTLAPDGWHVLTAEIKVSLLKAASGNELLCKARVLKPGRRLSFVESEVYCLKSGEQVLVAKGSATMAVVPANGG